MCLCQVIGHCLVASVIKCKLCVSSLWPFTQNVYVKQLFREPKEQPSVESGNFNISWRECNTTVGDTFWVHCFIFKSIARWIQVETLNYWRPILAHKGYSYWRVSVSRSTICGSILHLSGCVRPQFPPTQLARFPAVKTGPPVDRILVAGKCGRGHEATSGRPPKQS